MSSSWIGSHKHMSGEEVSIPENRGLRFPYPLDMRSPRSRGEATDREALGQGTQQREGEDGRVDVSLALL